MISFKQFTKQGRLGNQLFQYAFLRSTARRLGVKFYCPAWIGDKVFPLNDSSEREQRCLGIERTYHQPNGQICFSEDALGIQDHTDIQGYFQTEKFYQDKDEVRRWYAFKDEVIGPARSKYQDIDFSRSVGLHLRLGDWIPPRGRVYHRYIPRLSYYVSALAKMKHKEDILVFSDDMVKVRGYFRSLKGKVIFMEGNKDYEDLYLMSRCHDFISSPSTLSWWAAWLNPYRDRRIIVPKEGPLRCGRQFKRYALKNYWPKGYLQIRSLRPLLDNYYFALFREKVMSKATSLRKSLEKIRDIPPCA